MKNLIEQYKNWRKVSEEMLEDGFKGSLDCGEASVREDFSAFAGLTEEISFEAMLVLEKEYNTELAELAESAKEPLSENTLTWDEGQRKLAEEKRLKYKSAQEEYALGK